MIVVFVIERERLVGWFHVLLVLRSGGGDGYRACDCSVHGPGLASGGREWEGCLCEARRLFRYVGRKVDQMRGIDVNCVDVSPGCVFCDRWKGAVG